AAYLKSPSCRDPLIKKNMSGQTNFQKRINYQGNLNLILSKVCQDFKIGQYQTYEVVPIGYEDLNLILKTNKGKFFVKIFASFRDEKECQRYIKIMEKVTAAGVYHPKLYQHSQGSLYSVTNKNSIDRLCVIEYIDGKSYFQRQSNLTRQEMQFIIHQAALINNLDLRPYPVYDSWAIVNFLKEFKTKGQYLSKEDNGLICSYIKLFSTLDLDRLPHCFVHGDITKTNTMKSSQGKIYILDFAVANWYPRIQELAVLLCDLFFNKDNLNDFLEVYKFTLKSYQQYIPLTSQEIKTLPVYLQLAHAMHLLRANYERVVNKNISEENEHFLNIGKKGLRYTTKLFQKIV
ncbi:hypothetical protein COU86_05460, partial [Candidatus Roizmanbacteria bacterium CG10_big_fil_rev_8_21_14_0_10_36_26]